MCTELIFGDRMAPTPRRVPCPWKAEASVSTRTEPPGGARTGASSRGSREVSRDRVTESQSPKYVYLKGTQRRAALPHFCPVMRIVQFWRPQVHREEA